MSLSERSAPHALEGRQGPSVTDKPNLPTTTHPEILTENRGTLSSTNTSILPSTARTKRARLFVDSTGRYRSDDFELMLAAVAQEAEADRQYGRPLDYRDPTGDRATWNMLMTETARGRGRR